MTNRRIGNNASQDNFRRSFALKSNKFNNLSWLKWLLHPVTIFVLLQVVWITITLLWVIWFVGQIEEITKLARSFGTENFDTRYALAVMVVGCVLLGMILVGTVTLFILVQRQALLISQQNRFLSSVTHELRSPLASLRLHIETIKARRLAPEILGEISAMALNDIERLTRFVNQILVSARLDSGIGREDESEEIIDLRRLIEDTVIASQWLDAKLLDRTKIHCSSQLSIKASGALIAVIISNLLENAIKYSPTGSTIEIAVVDEIDAIVINVIDQGFGINIRDRKKIFKMFYRANITEKKAIPGTGLGLFIVKSLIESLGGKIWLRDRPVDTTGTTIAVRLPVHKVDLNEC